MNTLQTKGIKIAPVTLHVGYGTFLPIESDEVEEHVMEPEYYEISSESVEIINNAGRVIAVGTTSTRTLESAAGNDGYISSPSGFTNLFIYPGYKWKYVDQMITNFHVPKSTLLMLVSSFASARNTDGRDFILKAYETAKKEGYRFFSFGDSMMIV